MDNHSSVRSSVNANLKTFIATLFDRLQDKNAEKTRLIMKDSDFSLAFRGTDMAKNGNRLQTYISGNWEKLVSVSELTSAGFCFTGSGDKVVCFHCKGVLSSWEVGDVPITRHIEAFPHCKFARKKVPRYKSKSKLVFDNAKVTSPPIYNDERILEGEVRSTSFFNSEYNRLLSLLGLSTDHPATVKQLAKAGFCQDGESSNMAKCFACFAKIDVRQDDGEQPMERHRRLSPNCPFVNNLRTDSKSITEDETRQADRLFQRLAKTSSLTTPDQGTESTNDVKTSETDERSKEESQVKNTSEKADNPMYTTARYKEYFERSKRLESFKSWPANHFLKPAEFVDAGFFKSGKEDQVTCFYCGLNLLDWEPGDKPMEEHKREVPDCNWITFQTSRFCVKETLLHDQYFTVYDAEDAVRLKVEKEREAKDSSKTVHQSEENKTDIDQLIESEITTDIFNMGFSEEIVRHVFRQRTESGLPPFKTPEDLLHSIFKEEEKREQLKRKSGKSTVEADRNGVVDKETMDALEEKIEKLEERNTCKICLDEEVMIIFLPCKHLAVCEMCAERVETCPICREYIDDKLQVYIP